MKLTQIGSKIKPTIMKDIAVNTVFTVSNYMVGTVAAYSYSYLASYWLVVCNVMDIKAIGKSVSIIGNGKEV